MEQLAVSTFVVRQNVARQLSRRVLLSYSVKIVYRGSCEVPVG